MAAIMIVGELFTWASEMPSWLATLLLSALPVTESRLTIPVAITVWKLAPFPTYVFAMIGNAIPFFPIFFGFQWVKRFAERHAPWSVTWFERALDRVRRRDGDRYLRFGLIAITLFVMIPLPGTGVWSGTLLAVALELPFRKAIFAVLCGMLLMGAVVLALTLAGIAIG